ncbi:MAG TPA: hypothetical protein VNI60_08005 [Pyrinomonadaceae bacterium]|nr:hypothetical protein [Pyrinomonadaceae bacterium]
MENVMQTNLEQAIEIIRALPVENYDKIRKILDEAENAGCAKNETEINAKRAMEILQTFHDDFYNEQKDSFTQRELKDAV